MLKLSISILFCVAVRLVFAQAVGQDQMAQPSQNQREFKRNKTPDSLKIKFYPRAFRVGTDLISIIKSSTDPSFNGWEVNADVDCGKYYVALDYGSWGRTFNIEPQGVYTNQGTYWRVGIDANLLLKDPEKNMFFFGLRYAHSNFNEHATVVTTGNGPYGTFENQLDNNGVTASWFELTSGLKVKMWKEVWMGYTARMKVPPSVKGDGTLKSYDVPGYGRNGDGFYWGFEYQIFYRIPFGKDRKKAAPAPAGTTGGKKD